MKIDQDNISLTKLMISSTWKDKVDVITTKGETMGRYDNVGLTRADLTPPEDRLTTGVILHDDEIIRMWTCSCCGKEITHYDELEGKVHADIHFDVERSYKDLFIEDDCIEENLTHRNVKMNRTVCENCFNKILSESPTLRKTFECKIGGKKQIIF